MNASLQIVMRNANEWRNSSKDNDAATNAKRFCGCYRIRVQQMVGVLKVFLNSGNLPLVKLFYKAKKICCCYNIRHAIWFF